MAPVDPIWNTFEQRMNELVDLGDAGGLLGWDSMTFCPPKGRETRGAVLGTLAAIAHEKLVDPAFGDALAELESRGPKLSANRRAMVRNARRSYDRATKVPATLVRELTEQAQRTQTVWEKARPANDFAGVAPELTRMFALKREEAAALTPPGGEAYDALLDQFEPGMTVASTERLLTGLRDELVPFVKTVLDEPRPDTACLAGPYDHDAQLAFTRRVLGEVGFDFAAGRLDLSAHPFCGGGGANDVRLTTRVYDTSSPGRSSHRFTSAGTACYELGLPIRHRRTFLRAAPSYGLHESQSRFWENVIGRSSEFWERYLPVALEFFPAELEGVAVQDFVRAVNAVDAGFIRVDADEVTYNLHILVRFELELALLRGEIGVPDLPEAWREKMRTYLGSAPESDREGVLQDVHWYEGLVGYFPSYTIGNLYAATLAETMGETLDVEALVAAGDFAAILRWLREQVHGRGYLLEAEDLMQAVTGREISHEPFMRYLRGRYGALYGISA